MVEEAKKAAGIDINKPLASLVSLEVGRGVLLRIFGVVVRFSSPTPDPISDQNM